MILTITLNPSIDRRYLVDGFAEGKVFRAKEVQYTPGGKGINVAKVAHAFEKSLLTTGLLGGRSGDFIKEELDKMDIKHNFVDIDGETRSCIAILSDGASQTEVLESGPSISQEEAEAFYSFFESSLGDYEVITASGSLPKGLEVDSYKRLIQIAKKHKKKFILDTSGPALVAGLEAAPFLVKPNKEELEKLLGYKISNKDDIIKGARPILDKGVDLVLVSLGSDGALALDQDHIYQVSIPQVEAVNPVGSGDSMVAGLAVSIYRGYDLERTLSFAAACGTANAMEAETGKVDPANVAKLMEAIRVERLKA